MKASFIIYGAGLGLLLLSDVVISGFFPVEDIADWALLRSLIGISAVLPLTGLDQVLVRRPAASAQLLRLLAVQVPVLGLVVGMVLYITGILPNWWLGTLLAVGSALSLAQFQYFRSHHRKVLAQLSQQGWKVAAFGGVLIMALTDWRGDMMLMGVGLVLVVGLIMALIMYRLPPSRLHPQQVEKIGSHYAIGSRFMVTAFLLALAVYAEQIVVNRLGSSQEAALYFTSATYFLFPIAFLNGYLAFLIGPWVRDRHDKFIGLLRTKWLGVIAVAALTAAAVNGVGWWLWHVVSPAAGEVDQGLQILFFCVAFARTLYVLPSGYLGVFGMPRQHDILIVWQVTSLAPVIILFFVLQWAGFSLVHCVASASTLNWVIRTLVGYRMTAKVACLRAERQSL